MPVYHVRMSFSTREHGWVEQLYRQAPSFSAALLAAQSLALARYSILGAGVILWQVRVTQPGIPRAVATVAISGTTLATPAMLAQEGAEVRLTAGQAPSHRRSYFLRGLPAGAIANPLGPSRWASVVQAAALAWLQLLCDGLWLEKCRGYAGPRQSVLGLYPLLVPPANPLDPDGGPPSAGLWSEAVLAYLDSSAVPPPPPPGPTGPLLVRVGLVRWSDAGAAVGARINGEFPIAGQFDATLQYPGVVPEVGTALPGGYVQLRQAVYLPIRSAALTRAGTRKCGPPTASLEAPVAPAGSPGPSAPVVIGAPAGILTLPESVPSLGPLINPQVSPPPLVGPVVPPPFPPPVSATLNTARDALLYIAVNLTFSGSGIDYLPIGIVKVLNLDNTWAVFLAGFYPDQDTATGYLASVSAGLAQANNYAITVAALIEQNVPDDATLIFHGYSLGGMTAENVSGLSQFNERLKVVVTYGSPITQITVRERPIIRFKTYYDLVPQMTPLGFAGNVLDNLGYIVVRDDGVDHQFPTCHLRMYLNTSLDAWDAWGQVPAGRPPLVLGLLKRFRPIT